MIKAKVSTDYKDIERIFAGGSIQKEILKVWSTESNAYVFEAWKILEIEGPLPITFKANGEPLIDYRIYGNTEQTGTPTPENPIMPIGCGERTENLFAASSTSATVGTVTVSNDNGKITITGRSSTTISSINSAWKNAFTFRLKAGSYYFAGYFSDGIISYLRNANDDTRISMPNGSFVLSNDTDVYIGFWLSDNNDIVFNAMLNTGSTTLPYEPYGYKLPILSNSTVSNIYLGKVQTTRRIKKLVLTGEEDWAKRTYGNPKHTFEHGIFFRIIKGLCSHYANYTAAYIDRVNGTYLSNTTAIIITDLRFTAVTDFRDYLAAQYAAGTPVTVWYVLAEPETGIVNEPLMKIGNYADTIDSTQAAVQIPTSKGTTVIDYDGEKHLLTSDGYELVDKNQNGFLLSGSTLRPSKMYIKYKGR